MPGGGAAPPPPPEGTKSVFFKDSAILRYNDPVQIKNLDATYMSNFDYDENSKNISFNE